MKLLDRGLECYVLDGHSDILNDVVDRRARGARAVVQERHLPALRAGGVDGIVASIYVESRYKPERSLSRALHLIEAAHAEADETPDELGLCRSVAELRSAAHSGRVGFLLALEGAEPLGTGLSIVRLFYRLGVRLVGLTWNQRNQFGDGIYEDRTGSRLTQSGVALVRELNRIGVAIDLAHAAESTFYDVLEISEQPVVVTHSNCDAVCTHPRNLKDRQLEALAAHRGVLGITFHPPLVSKDAPCIDCVVKHIRHAGRVMGIEHVALGADFTDFMTWEPAEVGEGFDAQPMTLGLESVAGLPNLAKALLDSGYTSEEVAGVMGGNLARSLERVIG